MTTDYTKNSGKKPWKTFSTKPYLSSDTIKPWQKNQSTGDEEYTEQNTPSAIKNDIIDRLGDKYGKLDVINAIGKVDDELIQKNIAQAEDTIRTNIDTGRMSSEEYTKYPAMRNGLAVSYAAAESGNKKAERLGREAAYTKWKNDTLPTVKQDELDLTTKYDVNKLAKFNQRYAKKNDSQGVAALNAAPKNNNDLQGTTPVKMSLNNKDDAEKNKAAFTWGTDSFETLNNALTRYVDATSLNMRSEPGTSKEVVGNIKDGEKVMFTGQKTKQEKDGHYWAEVIYNGKRGWVAADYLRTQPKQKNSPAPEIPNNQNNTNTDKSYADNFIKNNAAPKYTKWNEKKPRVFDTKKLQEEFNEVGDFDGNFGLQCVDATKWFLNEFTTLPPLSGSGGEQVGKIANAYGLKVSKKPSAPAIFSVAPDKYGPGIRDGGLSDDKSGHTGIVLNVEKLSDNRYRITYFHTYNGLNDNGYNSTIATKEFDVSDNVTYVYIGDYMK